MRKWIRQHPILSGFLGFMAFTIPDTINNYIGLYKLYREANMQINWLQWVLPILPIIGACLFAIVIWPRRNTKIITEPASKIDKPVYPLRDWIDDASWTVQKRIIPNSIAYQIVLGNAPVLITRQDDKPEVVNLVSSVPLAHPKLSQEHYERLISQISRELNQLHIQHAFTSLNQLQIIHYAILDDSITEYIFRDKIMDVIRARNSVVNLWQDAIRQFETPNADKGDSRT